MSNCGNQTILERYTHRHNMILNLLASWLRDKLCSNSTLYVDLPVSDFLQVSDLFNGLRPDLAIMINSEIHVLELTVCHESNLSSSKAYKETKYKQLSKHKAELIKHCSICVHTFELSVLGFLAINKSFFSHCNIPYFDKDLIGNLIKSAISSTHYIYTRRNLLI